ncbi:MAG: NAD-dependent deacylase [Peptococcaceae bacterium]|nr:NAD-dependent deacylase [Peptococcaceae bacterium]
MEELIEKTAQHLAKSQYAVALTGAGISTESGIPDYRGPNGVWVKNPEEERKAYLIYDLFRRNPEAYWQENLENPRFKGMLEMKPNPGHYALVELEEMGILKAIVTQNIDNLHAKAGSRKVLDYHGNLAKLRCENCQNRYPVEEFDLKKIIYQERKIPLCRNCGYPLKSDVVYFGEPIPEDVASLSLEEAQKCDVMLICGTSATVYPFASLPFSARNRPGVIIIEVNAESTPLTRNKISNYLIKGKTGEILPQIVKRVKELKKN